MNKIKKYIESKIGSKIVIVYLGNRSKEEKYSGFIDKAYRNIFTIITDNDRIKSFSYVDVLVGNIRVYI